MELPQLSIITITFNAASTLEKTIKSVENQDYQNIEYIIVDGASTDATMSIVERYSHVVTRSISEPDNGLYDAMNKGLTMATGDYIWFLNSGDELADTNVIRNMFTAMPNADIYYGDTMMIDGEGNLIGTRRLQPPTKLTWKSFRNGMLVSHQSFVPRRELCPPYNLKYRFSADFDWCIKIMKQCNTICNTQIVLSHFLDGGITKQNIVAGLKERFRIMCCYYGVFSTILYHIPISIKFFWFWLTRGRF